MLTDFSKYQAKWEGMIMSKHAITLAQCKGEKYLHCFLSEGIRLKAATTQAINLKLIYK